MSGEGKIVAIVGNSGVGKTALARLLGSRAPFRTLLEQHEERPFHRLFSQDLRRYALANQVDYLLYRAEQERSVRRGGGIGVQDGGLEMDFHVFTRLFYEKGYLTQSEFGLCSRLYETLRTEMPMPEVFVWLQAPLDIVAERFARRKRELSIADQEDLQSVERLLSEWLENETRVPVARLDASADDPTYVATLNGLITRLSEVVQAGR